MHVKYLFSLFIIFFFIICFSYGPSLRLYHQKTGLLHSFGAGLFFGVIQTTLAEP